MPDPNAGPGPVQDPITRAKVTELHAKGPGRNAIASDLGLSRTTVTRIAQALSLDFSREQTQAAVKARSVDLAAARQRLAEKMTATAERLLDDLHGPYLVYAFGGRDNEYNEHELAKPPVEVQRTAVSTAGITFDKATKFLETSGDGESEAKSLLADLGRALGIGAG